MKNIIISVFIIIIVVIALVMGIRTVKNTEPMQWQNHPDESPKTTEEIKKAKNAPKEEKKQPPESAPYVPPKHDVKG